MRPYLLQFATLGGRSLYSLFLFLALVWSPPAPVAQAPRACTPYFDPAEPDSIQGPDGRWATILHFPAQLPNATALLVRDPDQPSLSYLADFATVEWPLPLDTVALGTFMRAFGLEPRGTWPPLDDTVDCIFRFTPPADTFRGLEAFLGRLAKYPGVRSVHAFPGGR